MTKYTAFIKKYYCIQSAAKKKEKEKDVIVYISL